MDTYIIDIILLTILLFFTWRGGKKGLILTLFSLLAVFIAFFGARAVSTHFSAPVANLIEPSIQRSITALLPTSDGSGAPDSAEADGTENTEDTQPSETDFQQILDLLQERGLYTGFSSLLAEAAESKRLEIVTTAAAAVSAYLAGMIASAGLFLLAFFLILLLCFLLSYALDLAFRLPVLSGLNTLGGAVLGFVKGAAVLLFAVWAARLTGLLTDENSGVVAQLLTADGLSTLLRSFLSGS